MQINKILRYILFGGIFLIPFIPLIITPSMFFPFITGKNFVFRILVEVLLGAWLILAWRDAQYRPKFSWILGTLAIFLGVITVADIFGENFFRSFWSNYERMEGLITHIHLFVYFLVAISLLKTEYLWERFFHASFGVSIFMALYGFLQLSGELVINQGGVRLDGTFGNATYLAVYMLFNIFLALLWAIKEKVSDAAPIIYSGFIGFWLFALYFLIRFGNSQITAGSVEKSLFVVSLIALGILVFLFFKYRASNIVRRILYGLLILLQITILYHTASRGSILGLIGGVALTAFLFAIFARKRLVLKKISIGFIIAIIIFVGGFIALRNTSVVQENPVLQRFAVLSLKEGKSRFLIWDMSRQGFAEHPIFGWGQENFILAFNKYYDPKMYNQEPWFDRSHNIIFDWLIAGGILALLAYLSIFGATLYYLWFYKRKESLFSPFEKSILTGLFAAYFFHNLFVFDNIISYILFFSVIAYIHTKAILLDDDVVEQDRSFLDKHREGLTNQMFAPLVIIVMIFLIYSINAKGFLNNRQLLQGMAPQQEGIAKNLEHFKKAISYNSFGISETREQLTQTAANIAEAPVSLEIKQEFFDLARNEMAKQIEEVPNNARYPMFTSLLLLQYRMYDEALVQLEKAKEISPLKQDIYFALGNAYLGKGDFGSALEITREAFELEPKNEQARRIYAAAAIYAGLDDLAEELLIPTYGTTELPEPVFVNAYLSRGQYDRVVRIWEKQVENNPNNAQSRLSLAASYIEIGEREKAIKELEKVIELSPDFREQGEFFISEIRAGRKP